MQLSVEGGLLQNTYRVSVGYTSTTELYNSGRGNDRLTVGLSFNHRSPNGKLAVELGSNTSYTNNETAATVNYFTLAPNAPGSTTTKDNTTGNLTETSTAASIPSRISKTGARTRP